MLELSQRIGLEQKLSPQQILLSTLLQIPALNMEMRIQQEMEINPILELDITDDDEIEIDLKEKEKDDGAENDELSEKLEKEEDIDWEKIQSDDDSYETKLPRDYNNEEIERQDAIEISIQEKLIDQIHELNLNKNETEIAEYIIWNLREDGYLDEQLTLETIAHIFDSNTQVVEQILQKIQRFEPKGMGSRNLRECLMIQLEDKIDSIYLLAYDILRLAYDELVNKRFEKISQIVEAELDEIKLALELIAKLNPKPSEGLFNQKMNYIIPDFIIEKQDDEIIVMLNDWNTPNLRISKRYQEIMNDKKKNKKAKSFIRKKVEAAKWFISSIEQRKITMLKVMNAIVEEQKDFFLIGTQAIKPLIMKTIAERIHMDISTVSRVTNGKYVQTDYGIFELKSFFSEKMETLEGEEVSTKLIKEKIREICESEDKKRPLSDEVISTKLIDFGYKVARRTVAKYREQLGIPVARLRREIV